MYLPHEPDSRVRARAYSFEEFRAWYSADVPSKAATDSSVQSVELTSDDDDDENGDTLSWLTLDVIKEVLNLKDYSISDLAMCFAPVADEQVGDSLTVCAQLDMAVCM